jgi:hypothetical protein
VAKNATGVHEEQIWCVCDSLLGIVESYHPSRAWAVDSLDQPSIARPATMQAMVRPIEATFPGQAHRVVTTTWDRYGATLAVAGQCPDPTSRECLLHYTALSTGRSRRFVRGEMRRFLMQSKPARRMPAHALDVPEPLAIASDDYRPGPTLAREEAMQLAAQENRQYLAQGPAWTGRWCLVVELSLPLVSACISSEFAGPLGIESVVLRRALRLVRPTAAEIARLARNEA